MSLTSIEDFPVVHTPEGVAALPDVLRFSSDLPAGLDPCVVALACMHHNLRQELRSHDPSAPGVLEPEQVRRLKYTAEDMRRRSLPLGNLLRAGFAGGIVGASAVSGLFALTSPDAESGILGTRLTYDKSILPGDGRSATGVKKVLRHVPGAPDIIKPHAIPLIAYDSEGNIVQRRDRAGKLEYGSDVTNTELVGGIAFVVSGLVVGLIGDGRGRYGRTNTLARKIVNEQVAEAARVRSEYALRLLRSDFERSHREINNGLILTPEQRLARKTEEYLSAIFTLRAPDGMPTERDSREMCYGLNPSLRNEQYEEHRKLIENIDARKAGTPHAVFDLCRAEIAAGIDVLIMAIEGDRVPLDQIGLTLSQLRPHIQDLADKNIINHADHVMTQALLERYRPDMPPAHRLRYDYALAFTRPTKQDKARRNKNLRRR